MTFRIIFPWYDPCTFNILVQFSFNFDIIVILNLTFSGLVNGQSFSVVGFKGYKLSLCWQ